MRYLFSILLLVLMSFAAKAQYSFTGTVSGTVNVSAIQSVSITGGSAIPSFTTFSHYTNGITMSSYLTVAVKSNISWMISVKAQNTYFTPMSSNGSTNMPSTVMSLKSATSANYTALTTNGFTLKTGNKGNTTTTGNTFNVDMKFNPGFDYQGGIYSIGLLYTLTAQ